MSVKGKVIGGILGSMLGGPFGAVLGVAIGHTFDKDKDKNGSRYQYRESSGQTGPGFNLGQAQMTFFVATNPMAVVPCAISCAWHSISGTILANIFARRNK